MASAKMSLFSFADSHMPEENVTQRIEKLHSSTLHYLAELIRIADQCAFDDAKSKKEEPCIRFFFHVAGIFSHGSSLEISANDDNGQFNDLALKRFKEEKDKSLANKGDFVSLAELPFDHLFHASVITKEKYNSDHQNKDSSSAREAPGSSTGSRDGSVPPEMPTKVLLLKPKHGNPKERFQQLVDELNNVPQTIMLFTQKLRLLYITVENRGQQQTTKIQAFPSESLKKVRLHYQKTVKDLPAFAPSILTEFATNDFRVFSQSEELADNEDDSERSTLKVDLAFQLDSFDHRSLVSCDQRYRTTASYPFEKIAKFQFAINPGSMISKLSSIPATEWNTKLLAGITEALARVISGAAGPEREQLLSLLPKGSTLGYHTAIYRKLKAFIHTLPDANQVEREISKLCVFGPSLKALRQSLQRDVLAVLRLHLCADSMPAEYSKNLGVKEVGWPELRHAIESGMEAGLRPELQSNFGKLLQRVFLMSFTAKIIDATAPHIWKPMRLIPLKDNSWASPSTIRSHDKIYRIGQGDSQDPCDDDLRYVHPTATSSRIWSHLLTKLGVVDYSSKTSANVVDLLGGIVEIQSSAENKLLSQADYLSIVKIYERLQVKPRTIAEEEIIRLRFFSEKLVYVKGTWYSGKDCLWDANAATGETDVPVLSKIYPELGKLFVDILHVHTNAVDHLIKMLHSKTLKNAAIISSLIKISESNFDNPSKEALSKLETVNFLPMRDTDGSEYQVGLPADLMIPDHELFAQLFRSHMKSLDVSAERYEKLKDLLLHFDVRTRLLSKHVHSVVTGYPGLSNISALEEEVRKRAYGLFCYAVHRKSKYSAAQNIGLYYKLSGMSILDVDHVSSCSLTLMKNTTNKSENVIAIRHGSERVFDRSFDLDESQKWVFHVPKDTRARDLCRRYDLPRMLRERMLLPEYSGTPNYELELSIILSTPLNELNAVMKDLGISPVSWFLDPNRTVPNTKVKTKGYPQKTPGGLWITPSGTKVRVRIPKWQNGIKESDWDGSSESSIPNQTSIPIRFGKPFHSKGAKPVVPSPNSFSFAPSITEQPNRASSAARDSSQGPKPKKQMLGSDEQTASSAEPAGVDATKRALSPSKMFNSKISPAFRPIEPTGKQGNDSAKSIPSPMAQSVRRELKDEETPVSAPENHRTAQSTLSSQPKTTTSPDLFNFGSITFKSSPGGSTTLPVANPFKFDGSTNSMVPKFNSGISPESASIFGTFNDTDPKKTNAPLHPTNELPKPVVDGPTDFKATMFGLDTLSKSSIFGTPQVLAAPPKIFFGDGKPKQATSIGPEVPALFPKPTQSSADESASAKAVKILPSSLEKPSSEGHAATSIFTKLGELSAKNATTTGPLAPKCPMFEFTKSETAKPMAFGFTSPLSKADDSEAA